MPRSLALTCLLTALVAAGCGDESNPEKKPAVQSATSTPAPTAQADYAKTASESFNNVVDARHRWEDAQGDDAVRAATEDLAEAEQDMLDKLNSTAVPERARALHDRMVSALRDQHARLAKLAEAKPLDTDAIDTQVGRTIEVERIVAELFTLPSE